MRHEERRQEPVCRDCRDCPHTLTCYAVRYTCDGCGKAVSRENHENDYAHELQITLDADECVSFLRWRDYCPACLEPVWAAVNELLGTDPDEQRDREYDIY